MAGKKGNESGWKQVTVPIRTDILDELLRQGRDIAEECNQALADRYGIDYQQQKIPATAFPLPVIIAPNSLPPVMRDIPGKPSKPGSFTRTPVLNAEDPRIAKALKSGDIPRQKPPKNLPPPAMAQHQEDETSLPVPAKPASPKAVKRPDEGLAPEKKKKEDLIKKFVTSMITRDTEESAKISKEEMYSAFERWCRDRKFSPVPAKRAFAIALKNRFAIGEKNPDGVPSWVSVRLK